jgi:S1-C subfamily serine protease
MDRVVLRHLSGSKRQQVEEIPVDRARDLLIGRDPAAQVKFDPDQDDLVGRQHARILQDASDPQKYSIVDLNSRNGTYVNRQRVAGTVVLNPGDVIQLGPGGPEFQFDLDPPPATLVKATRLAAGPVPATRESAAPATVASGKATVGKETVERMVSEARRDTARKSWVGIAASLIVAVGLIGLAAWQWNRRADAIAGQTGAIAAQLQNQPLTTRQIADQFAHSAVFIEFSWKLVFAGTGEQIYHEYHVFTDEKTGRPIADQSGNVKTAPIFLRLANGRIVPRLTLDRGAMQQNAAISCNGSGSGFVVTTDGFVLTNRHVAANWEARYSCFPSSGEVLLVTEGQKGAQRYDIRQLPLSWIPATDGREVSGKRFEGQNTYLDVTFALNKLRFPAQVARVSDRADVTLIKVNTPQPVKKVDLFDATNELRVGNVITVIGYPGVSPDVYVATKSVDALSTERRVSVIPDPTVTPGTIGRIIRGQMNATQGTVFDYSSGFGDTLQLTINETGAGNSGGPVFDDKGRVIAIYTYGRSDMQGTTVSFAVPIKYGLELMGTSAAVSN